MTNLTKDSKITFSQKFFPAISCQSPKIVKGTPSSLLKLPLDFRTERDPFKTAYIASFVEVLPTLPVTATTPGLYFLIVQMANCRIIRCRYSFCFSLFINLFQMIRRDI